MALKIRLRQQGRTNRKFYRLVVIDGRTPRDGKYIESIGWYDPCATEEDRQLMVKPDRAEHWIKLGAELTEKSKSLIARGAPAVIKNLTAQQLATRSKAAAQRRARKKAAKA